MELDQIKTHWDKLSELYAKDLKSTTKTPTIKKLEINAFANCLRDLNSSQHPPGQVLEVGCGNGHNLFGLAALFPDIRFTGVDYSGGMIDNAIKLKSDFERDDIEFFEGDILRLEQQEELQAEYDVVFTNRCIINLNTIQLQFKGLRNLVSKVATGGHILLIENSLATYGKQNECRRALDLDPRTPDPYNLFLDQEKFLSHATDELGLRLVDTVDFGSLHDVLLYVLIPSINEGKVDYAHPLMESVTEMLLNLNPAVANSFGSCGQNRLFVFRK